MKLYKLILGIIATFFAIPAMMADTVSRYDLKVGDFTDLNVIDGLNVIYKCSEDSAGTAVFETTKAIASQIIFENNNKGKLKIEKQFHDENELRLGLPVITVYSKFLNSVQNSGDSTVVVEQFLPTAKFNATVMGNGTLIVRGIDCSKFEGSLKTGRGQLVVNGKCENATLTNVGTGSIQADQLKATSASCRFLGTGTIGVWATKSLTVKGMMAGKLYYKGTTAKITNYSVGPKLISLDSIGAKETEE